MATIRLGDEAPNFTANSTEGEINFHDWLGESWGYYFLIQQITHQFVLQN